MLLWHRIPLFIAMLVSSTVVFELTTVRAAGCPLSDSGIVNVLSEPWRSFEKAVRAIGNSECTLLVPEPVEVRKSIIVPANIQLWFTRGGSLRPRDPRVTVTIEGAILAPQSEGPTNHRVGVSCPERPDFTLASQQAIFDVSSGGRFLVTWTGELIANWWSGADIAERWNNMKASIDLGIRGVRSRRYKVVGEHCFWTAFDMTGIRNGGKTTLDFSEARLFAVGISGPAMDMTHSQGLLVYDLKLQGLDGDIGILLARSRANVRDHHPRNCPKLAKCIDEYGCPVEGKPPDPAKCTNPPKCPDAGKASGNHIFHGAQINGNWRTAAVYNVKSEVNTFIGGDFTSGGGRYIMFFGFDVREGDVIESTYDETGIDRTCASSAAVQDLIAVRVNGKTNDGGVFVHGFRFIRMENILVRNAGPGPQIVLDAESQNMPGIEISRFKSEGSGNPGTKPTIALKIQGKRRVSNLLYDHVSDGASEFAVDIKDTRVLFSEFRINSKHNFRCSSGAKLEQVKIVLNARNQSSDDPSDDRQILELGHTFVGEIHMAPDSTTLVPASVRMQAVIHAIKTDKKGNEHQLDRLELADTDLKVDGNITVAGTITEVSDQGLKRDVTTLSAALEKILALRGITYRRKADATMPDGMSEIGFLAQEVETVLPEVVVETRDGLHGVAYGRVVPVLVEALKELSAEVATLKHRLENVETERPDGAKPK